jgi:hypothetical protein
MEDDIRTGIKTFFVYPDVTAMPKDECLPAFFLNGFETYYILEDQFLDLETQIAVLASQFKEMLLFFNINKKITGLRWEATAARATVKYGSQLRIGVLHKEEDPAAKLALEKAYLFEIGVQCGCVQLGNGKIQNRKKLLGVLLANEANGRRKALRMICVNAKFNFSNEAKRFEGRILDVSISHFTGVFSGKDPGLSMFSKMQDIQMFMPGGVCNVSAVICGKRAIENGAVAYVFVFCKKSEDNYGLDERELRIVSGAIYEHFQREMEGFLKQEFYRSRSKA